MKNYYFLIFLKYLKYFEPIHLMKKNLFLYFLLKKIHIDLLTIPN